MTMVTCRVKPPHGDENVRLVHMTTTAPESELANPTSASTDPQTPRIPTAPINRPVRTPVTPTLIPAPIPPMAAPPAVFRPRPLIMTRMILITAVHPALTANPRPAVTSAMPTKVVD